MKWTHPCFPENDIFHKNLTTQQLLQRTSISPCLNIGLQQSTSRPSTHLSGNSNASSSLDLREFEYWRKPYYCWILRNGSQISVMAQLMPTKSSFSEIVEGLRSIHEETRKLCPEVLNILCLLLVIPTT
ncbi:hypothetical protein PR048_012840 [Dryococelus australis]|uniref:Uncharacterized protein n=1 Tax=Dryococelus australis TaxID=614101 RepID=A0ABQ9HRY5_9NEOP|nr:hypothetical protein PR048_012840 [Dryococelus australis]